MPPRRRSKKTADADNASARSTPPPPGSLAIGPLLEDVDTEALLQFFPEATFDAPSPALVVQCYQLILEQAKQLDEKESNIEKLEAEVERKEVELEQEAQDKENLLEELDTASGDVREKLKKCEAEKEEIGSWA